MWDKTLAWFHHQICHHLSEPTLPCQLHSSKDTLMCSLGFENRKKASKQTLENHISFVGPTKFLMLSTSDDNVLTPVVTDMSLTVSIVPPDSID